MTQKKHEREGGGASSAISFAASVLLFAAMILTLPVTIFFSPMLGYAPTVSVHDQAGVFDRELLERELGELRFRQDIRLEVISLTGWGNTNLDAAVASFADQELEYKNDIRTVDYRNWKEGVVIIAVAPRAHQVGVYPGADISLKRSEQVAIQDAAVTQFSHQDWNGGVLAIGNRAETYLGAYGSGRARAAVAIAAVISLWGAGKLFFYLRRGITSRRMARLAASSYGQVTYDYDSTALRVGTLDPSAPESRELAARYERFERDYRNVTLAWQEFGDPQGLDWFGKSVYDSAKSLQERSAALDDGDDVIVDTVSILTMSPTWSRSWEKQQEPVLEKLRAVMRMAGSVRRRSAVDRESIARWVAQQNRRLGELTVELDKRELAPVEALAELDGMSRIIDLVVAALEQRREAVVEAVVTSSVSVC